MKEHKVDARNLRCPQPLMMAKKALVGMSAGEQLKVLVDNETSCDNLLRFFRDNGMAPGFSEEGGLFTIVVKKTGNAPPIGDTNDYCTPDRTKAGPIIVINHHGMGSGSEELGRVLLQACIFTIKDTSPQPTAILCYNAGVLVAEEGSPTAPALTDLVSRGVTLLLCGTCVDYYGLKGKLAVGTITNMYEILQRLSNSERIITL